MAPGPDATWAPKHESDSEVEDTEEDIPNTCPLKANEDLEKPFRVDVMIDDIPSGDLGIFEMKRWKGPATITDVNTQLDCYVKKARYRGFDLLRDARLNLIKWSRVYPDNNGNLWCAWADRDPFRRGNVYFGLFDELPEAIRDDIPGCDDDTQREVRTVFEVFRRDVAIAETAAKAYIIFKVLVSGAQRTGSSSAKAPPYPFTACGALKEAGMTLAQGGRRSSGCSGGTYNHYYKAESEPSYEIAPSVPPSTPPSSAVGGNVACGDLIIANTTLDGDVGPCTGHGIQIGADGITLDLNGHQIIGDSDPANGNVGVLFQKANLGAVTGSKVTDSSENNTGGVTAFDAGVAIVDGGTGNTVERLNVVANAGLLRTVFGEGIHVRNSSSNTIAHNLVVANSPLAGITLLDDADGNLVHHNVVIANHTAAPLEEPDAIGIRLEVSSATELCPDNNTVSDNLVSGNALDGISVLNGKACDSIGNTLSNNVVHGNGRDGIRLNGRYFDDLNDCRGADTTHVHDNRVEDNGGSGIRLTACVTGGHIHHNTALANNPHVVGPVTGGAAPGPHGDLHDNNFDCTPLFGAANVWFENVYVTEYGHPGSATNPTNPLDYACID